MFDYCFTFRSITKAQRGESALLKAGIRSSLLRTPKKLSTKGCGYSLKVRPDDIYAAVLAFENWKVDFGKLYRLRADGEAEEVAL